MNQKKSIPVAVKVIFIILGILIAVVLIGALWLSQHYKSVIKQQLPQVVARTGKGKYKSALGDVSINILTRKISFHHFSIWYDSTKQQKRPELTFNINIPHLYISGINWAVLLQEQRIDCAMVLLDQPDIRMIQVKDTSADIKEAADSSVKNAFPASIHIAEIRLVQSRLNFDRRSPQLPGYTIKHATVSLYDWFLNLQKKEKDSTRLLYARQVSLLCDSISFKNKNGLYTFTVDTFATDTRNRSLQLSNFRIRTTVSKKELYREIGHQTDIFNVTFRDVRMSGFDLRNVVYRHSVIADSMFLNKGAVDDYFSRLPPVNPASKLGKFPNQLLLKLPLTVNIPYTKVTNGHASYTEINEETELPGALKFDALSGFVTNITNDSAVIAKSPRCVLDLQGKFNKDADIHGRFTFLLNDTTGVFSVDGRLSNAHEQQVSAPAKALAKAEVSTVNVQELSMKIDGDQHQARGNTVFRYSDLALSVQKIDDNGKMKDRPLLSFLANKVLLFPANPMPGKDLRTVSTQVRRDPNKSFFNLIWRNIFEGIKATAIRNKDLADAVGKGNAKQKEVAPKDDKKNDGRKKDDKTSSEKTAAPAGKQKK